MEGSLVQSLALLRNALRALGVASGASKGGVLLLARI